MARAFRFLSIFLIAFTSSWAAAAADKPYANKVFAADGARYETYLKKNWKPGNPDPQKLKTKGNEMLALGYRPRDASRLFAAAVVADLDDANAWLGLARTLLAITPNKNRGSERYNLPVNAAGAAYIAYQKSKSDGQKADALSVLSQAAQRRNYWRSAITTAKLSLQLAATSKRQKAYDALRTQHGFRVLDYKIDSDAAQPRLCVQFSENLAKGQIDFAKFVSVGGKDPQSVNAETRQLCIDGLDHGKRYEIALRAGLPSSVGEKLLKSSELAVYVRDRSPTVRFTGRSYVLPNKGQQGIPLVSVNTDKVAIEVLRLGDRSLAATVQSDDFQKQISDWKLNTIRSKSGASIYKGKMDVASKLNEDTTTAFPVSKAIPELKPGVYVLLATPLKGKKRSTATQWFIVSDLGLTALSGDDGVHAFVRSLDSADPRANVSLQLIARNNEILGTATTNADGYARFAPGLARGEGGMAPAVLVARSANGDYAFLDLATAGFDLTDRGVKGREAPGPLDAYLYTDRGVYRPGEDVNLTGLVRDRAAKAAKLPVTLIVTRPDGVEHHRTVLSDEGLGGRSALLALSTSAMTGSWQAKLHADPKADPIARVKFLVEDFIPERMELKLKAKSTTLTTTDGGEIGVSGRYLYGPVAADMALEGDIVVRASTKPLPGLKGYHFGIADKYIPPARARFTSLPRTGKDGTAALKIKLPAIPDTARPLEARVMIRMREPGGRTIERSLVMPVDLRQQRIGIRPQFKDLHIGEDETANFQVMLLGTNGKPIAAKGLKWELSRLNKHWQWYRQDGSWRHEPVTSTRRVATGTIDSTGGASGEKPTTIEARVGWGRYRLEVSGADDGGPVTTVIFNAGWWTDDGADSPQMLEIALDKESYKPGETATLRIASKHGGKALVAVLNNGLATTKLVDVSRGGASVALTVDKSWVPGAYVTAMMYRPMDRKAKRMPGRSIGVRWLGLDASDRTLKVGLGVTEKVKSGTKLSVPVKLSGLKPGEEAYVTIAAVDVGILSLTRFKSPAPQKWFYSQRRMGMQIRDYYGRLIDGMRATRGRLRSGGDGPGGLSSQGMPPTGKPLSLFSGIIKVDANGAANVEFDLPEFNGSVRLMAVAWSNDQLGSATKDIVVRDPVVLLVSGPRFLTMGDQARLTFDVHNVEGLGGSYKLAINQENETGLKQSLRARDLTFKTDQRRIEHLTVKATHVGTNTYNLRVTGPGGIDVNRELVLQVMPPAADIKRTTVSKLKPGGSLNITDDLFASLIHARSKMTVNVGAAARLDVPGILNALDRYPYGCAEQTVSRALPLIYSNGLAAKIGIATDTVLKKRINGAIARLFEMQDSSGAFGIWGPSSTDLWLTSYVTDFLTRAREAGYKVRAKPMRQALDRLQNFVAYAQDFKQGGEQLAYALYVLARNGRAPIGELRYYVDTRLARFSTPLAKAQLGAALAMMGDRTRAQTAFGAAIVAGRTKDDGITRTDYGTGLRDNAAVLTLISETGVAKAQTAKLVDVVASTYAAKSYTSTQEQAWILLAARALSEESRSTLLSINGKSHKGEYLRGVTPGDLANNGMTITNTGSQTVDAVVTVMGASLTPEPAVSKGFRIERSYYTLDGKQVDLESATGGEATLQQNDRLVVVLKVMSDRGGGRVILVDRLPAGLEIENPRLIDSGDLKQFSWLSTTISPQTTQFRDDRFVAAFNFFGRNSNDNQKVATVAYMVRAVTPGSFVHPAATIEDMYRPDHFARTASGRLTVTAKQ